MDITKILEETINNIYLIKKDEIPNIDLYMDQVTTFMDSHLKDHKRNDEDKTLTKTMINNYAKNDLLPSPNKKKYSKEHILLLTLIYYYKSVMSINDIKKLMAPITERYFQGDAGRDMSYIYDEIISHEKDIISIARDDMFSKIELSKSAFEDAPKKEQDYLQMYAFVSLLSFDVYMKKQLIESIIDSLPSPMSKEERDKIAIEKAKAARRAAEKKAAEKKSSVAKKTPNSEKKTSTGKNSTDR
ncbi:MAG: DUF1836 domain-containing protein [Clostridiales bacterium]|nr:DUF1836 domain-containing protein [Clostridiales bacterium]